VDVESIGAGGGSLAWVDPAGALKVGPQSAGAEPGPACYGLGGTAAAVTDANLVLGYLGPGEAWGDTIHVRPPLAEAAVGQLARHFGLGLEAMAEGIVEIANSSMLGALRLVSVRKGYDLRRFSLVAYGGAGPVHAGRLARLLEIPRVIVPMLSGVFSAFGGLVSDLRYDGVRTVLAPLDTLDLDRLEALFRELEAECSAPLVAEGHGDAAIRLARSMDLRYVGQKYELEVPIRPGRPDRQDVSRLFDDRHRMVYSYATGEPLECVNARVSASVEAARPSLAERTVSTDALRRGERRAFFRETGEVSLPVYSRDALPLDWSAKGPLAIEDAWSTTLVYPGQRVTADRYGNLFIEIEP
jgi:N-methylhydantoinase A